MDCPDLSRNEFLEKYLLGELGLAEQDEFEIHILECVGCLQALETLQAVRDALSERAHEIRGRTPVRSVWFRWQWAVVMSVLLVAGVMGLYQLRQRHRMTLSERQTPAASKPTPPAEPAVDIRTIDLGKLPERLPSRKETASHPPKEPVSVEGMRARSNMVDVPAVGPTPSASSNNTGTPAAANQAQTPAAPQLAGNEASSDDIAKELFRLGVVQVPPYTFSGFAASSKTSKPHKAREPHDAGMGTSAVSTGDAGKGPAADSGRAHFQKAMDAYLEKRYLAAAGLLEVAVSDDPTAADANFFLGICRLLNAQPADAIPPLRVTLTNGRSPYTQAAHFYLAKAYVQIGNLSQAEEELRIAADMTGRLTTEATSMLARLQAVRFAQAGRKQKDQSRQPN